MARRIALFAVLVHAAKGMASILRLAPEPEGSYYDYYEIRNDYGSPPRPEAEGGSWGVRTPMAAGPAAEVQRQANLVAIPQKNTSSNTDAAGTMRQMISTQTRRSESCEHL